MENSYLPSAIAQFEYYKSLGEKTMSQLPDDALFWQYNDESNSIATIVKHLAGNMLSRWTHIFTEDGEKPWRNREAEFENDLTSRQEIIQKWNEGWDCLLNTLKSLDMADLQKITYIRNQGHTVQEAINRQLCHYPYHIGQIVFIGKMVQNEAWQTLSIARGNSEKYNNEKFAREKRVEHFTQEIFKKTEL